MFQEVKVAAISFRPKKLDLDSNVRRLEASFRSAAEQGVQLALAPEGILEGYVVNEIITGQFQPNDILDVAVTIDSQVIKRFQKLFLAKAR